MTSTWICPLSLTLGHRCMHGETRHLYATEAETSVKVLTSCMAAVLLPVMRRHMMMCSNSITWNADSSGWLSSTIDTQHTQHTSSLTRTYSTSTWRRKTLAQSFNCSQQASKTTSTVTYPSDAHCCHMGTAIKHPVPDRVKPSFVIVDIWAFCRSTLRVTVPGCITYSCTHMATVGIKWI